MAYKAFHVCDHCGKVLDEMKDYVNCVIDEGLPNIHRFDLCYSCAVELDNMIHAFITEKRGDGNG